MKNWLILCVALLFATLAHAADPDIAQQLNSDDSDEKIAAIQALVKRGDDNARLTLRALAEEALYTDGTRLFRLDGEKAIDTLTGAALEPAPETTDTITINNRVRRELDAAVASLRLFAPERDKRLAAARELRETASLAMLPLLDKALAAEKDPAVRAALTLAHARAGLQSEDAAVRREAATELGASADANVKPLLAALLAKKGDAFAEADASVREAAAASLATLESRVARAEAVGRVFSGISLGSILLLAALGLAITYGVMGVINMAHGELLMIGAYSTYAMQTVFRRYLPEFVDYYVIAAIPVAFFAAALVGVAMERLVIRHLYGRALETLLATWGLSLVLIQASRVIFGSQNVEVANPAWMSGGIELWGGVQLPLNRIYIIAFAAFVLVLVWLMMQKTRLGMFVRAVTQNRSMAGCVGVPTGRIDTLAFAIGAGIAGLGGVALSQIANVGPDMGQGYIVDSFMVVVLGGVGQLAGAVWAALGLGIVSKFLEGWTGAVIAKILVLVFIIVFIQKRPQGLFAIKGRFVES